MGSPPMNLVDGRGARGPAEDGRDRGPAARGVRHEGPVIAGVRPTDLAARTATRAARRCARELEVVERLGSESHVIFPVDAQSRRGEAAAAADEATEDGDATLLADDDRARFTARVAGRRPASRWATSSSSPSRPRRSTCSIRRPARRCARRLTRAAPQASAGTSRSGRCARARRPSPRRALGHVDRADQRMRRERAHRVVRVARPRRVGRRLLVLAERLDEPAQVRRQPRHRQRADALRVAARRASRRRACPGSPGIEPWFGTLTGSVSPRSL